jgi:hypothetical protein
MNRTLLSAFLAFVAVAIFAACESETGPTPDDQGLGRKNGCIDTECASGGATSSSGDEPKDAGKDTK